MTTPGPLSASQSVSQEANKCAIIGGGDLFLSLLLSTCLCRSKGAIEIRSPAANLTEGTDGVTSREQSETATTAARSTRFPPLLLCSHRHSSRFKVHAYISSLSVCEQAPTEREEKERTSDQELVIRFSLHQSTSGSCDSCDARVCVSLVACLERCFSRLFFCC